MGATHEKQTNKETKSTCIKDSQFKSVPLRSGKVKITRNVYIGCILLVEYTFRTLLVSLSVLESDQQILSFK